MLLLFRIIFSDPNGPDLDKVNILKKLETNKLTDADNNWEKFFWVVIMLAIVRRFITFMFKFLLIPFKIAFIYYILKYLGFYFTNLFNVLNNLSLGIID
jgi:hypothetical protein